MRAARAGHPRPLEVLLAALVLLGVMAWRVGPAFQGPAPLAVSPAPAAPSPSALAGPAPGTVRLATWNVQDLFDEVDDPDCGDEVPTAAQVQDKLRRVATVLAGLQADLVALQEVEKGDLLRRLAAEPALRAAGYRAWVLEEGNDTARGIDVAFLSRVPLEGYRSHKDLVLPEVRGNPPGSRFTRDCLEVHVALPEPIVVLVNHFKSRAGRDPDRGHAKRRAQAEGVLQILRGLGEAPVAVVGDLNDRPDVDALAPLLREGPLADVLGSLPEAERATLVFDGRPIALDYILVNAALAPRVVPGSARVVRGEDVRAASDHFPVVVDLRSGGGGPAPEAENTAP